MLPNTGVPLKLTHVLEVKDGKSITVRDRLLDWLRLGFPRDTSCARVGVTKQTFHHWLREAARLQEIIALDPSAYDQLTPNELDVLTFSQEVDEAIAEGEARYFTLLAQIARGGIPVQKTIEKYDSTGALLERTITTENTIPSERSLMWILERRYPSNYPRGPQQIEVALTGHTNDPLNEQERARALLAAINSIETTQEPRGA